MRLQNVALLTAGLFLGGCSQSVVRFDVDGGSCAAPQVVCGSTCTSLQTDDAHCGSCDHACPANEGCGGGQCFPRDCGDTDCSGAQICFEGHCEDKACVGVVCPSAQTCHFGACLPRACGSATCDVAFACIASTCTDVRCLDVGCPSGKLCGLGVCVQRCDAGVDCTPSNPCRTGAVACGATGATCVESGNRANGTACGADQVCRDGACAGCVADAGCATNASTCKVGTTSCATGTQTCVDTAAPRDAGVPCGVDQVCNGGACVGCVASASCATNPSACKLGMTSCATGAQTCVDATADRDAGLPCGVDQVCSGGACVGCVASAACAPTNACHRGLTACGTGAQVCVDTGASVDAGVGCGADQVCSPGGSCVACAQGSACTTNPGAPCLTGVVQCATGAPTCADGVAVAGTVGCGAGRLCQSGACTTLASCLAVLRAFPDAGSGLFTIDPDGADAGVALTAYCDQQTDGGGWTLCARTHPTFTGSAMLTTTWGTVTDGTQPFGIGCSTVMAAEHDAGVGEYRFTGTKSAVPTAVASVAWPAFFSGGFAFTPAPTTTGDPLWAFIDGACNYPLPGPVGSCSSSRYACATSLLLQGAAPTRPGIVLLFSTGPGPAGCGTSYEQMFYGSDGVAVNYNSVGIGGSTPTNYTGAFALRYRHGCCSYAYYSTDESAGLPMATNLPVFHWVR